MAAVLRAAIETYPQTRALKEGRVASDLLRLEFTDYTTINRAFAPMVRNLAFDVSEMAIATFLQAAAVGRPLVLLPVVLAQRFQEGALFCRADSDIAGPADLAGRRVGIRAYGQTTGMWLRGILAEQYGVAASAIRWTTFEGAHVAEIADPPDVVRAPDGAEMIEMLHAGALDAVIVGNNPPRDARLRTVFPDPERAAAAFMARHGLVPVNHMLTVTRELATERPELIAELLRMVTASARMGHDASPLPSGVAALQPAVALALSYAQAQGLLPRALSPAEIWHGLPSDLANWAPS